jgi:drug/metabolite transporter (DMT)-like permease
VQLGLGRVEPRGGNVGAGQEVEQRGLATFGQADEADLHAGEVYATNPLKPLDPHGVAIALLLAALWGANPAAIKIGLADVPPIRLAWMRFLVGGLVVTAWAWRSGRFASFRIEPHEWRPLLVLGALFTVQLGMMNVGTNLTTASHATILLNSYAVHTVVLAHFMIPGDHLTWRKASGVAVAYSGAIILFAREWTAGASTLPGDLIVAASAFLLAERTIYLARAVHRLDAVKLLLAQAVIGTMGFILISAVFEEHIPTRWTASLGAVVLYQGVVIAGFNFITNLWLLRRYRPSALAACFLTTPVFGVVAAALLTGDRLTPDLLVSAVLVAIGIGLTAR